jgi:hypothetical protein
VVLVAVVTLIVLLFVVWSIPRQRETARLAGCRRNLMQIGMALALYDHDEGALPTVPRLPTDSAGTDSPLKAILASLELPDLTRFAPNTPRPKRQPGSLPGERPVAGFFCPSDTRANAEYHPAPVSYRASTGNHPEGQNGAFAPGRILKLADIEAGDGLSYTTAFSERLVGRGSRGVVAPENYAEVAGPLVGTECPEAPLVRWQGDAGRSWADLGWRSTLYNHALPPGAAPSCIAGDHRAALMGASSGHLAGVNVLNCDGSVRTITRTIAPPIWKALATTHSPASPGPEPR